MGGRQKIQIKEVILSWTQEETRNPYRILSRQSYGEGMWHVWGRGEGYTGFWWGNMRERDHWGDPDADGRIILRWIFRKREGVVGTGWRWLRIGTGGGHL